MRIDSHGQAISAITSPEIDALAINVLGPIPLPLNMGGEQIDALWYVAVRHTELRAVEQLAARLRDLGNQNLFAELSSSMAVNSVLIIGDLAKAKNPLVRVHSNCLTGDVFGSQRCECGPQLHAALHRIHGEPEGGILVYMNGHEGRGIGLWAKAATYILQDSGENTYQANRSLGLAEDSRDFRDAGALLLHFLGDRPFRLMTNNPKKVNELKEMGLRQFTTEKHVVGIGDYNRRYLSAKKDWGHQLDEDDLTSGSCDHDHD